MKNAKLNIFLCNKTIIHLTQPCELIKYISIMIPQRIFLDITVKQKGYQYNQPRDFVSVSKLNVHKYWNYAWPNQERWVPLPKFKFNWSEEDLKREIKQ